MKININKKAVGSRIKQIRMNKGYTLEAFGKLFNASKGNVQQWENGVSLPNKERLASISKIADMTVNELLYGSIENFILDNAENIIKSQYGKILFTTLTLNNILLYCLDSDNININDINSLTNNIIQGFENLLEQRYNENQERIYFLKNNYIEASHRFEMLVKNGLLHNIIINGESIIDSQNIELLEKLSDFNVFLNAFNDKIFSYENSETLLSELFIIVEDNASGFNGYYQEVIFLNITLDYLLHTSSLYDIDIQDSDQFYRENNYASSIWEYNFPYKPNKYNLSNFDYILGLYIETENSTYFLANYNNFEKVPLNTEAQYFILNHDNSYLITKITEKPDCKYLAPIIGKLE